MRNNKTEGKVHLREENELTKLRLFAQFGTDTGSIENIPAEIERDWLKKVEAIEQAHQTARKVTIASYLGNPTYTPERQLDESGLGLALAQVLNDLDRAGIDVDTVCKVPDRDFYRYLTEELVLEDIPDIKVDGLRQHFVFDEFFPNDEFEIEHTLIEFFEMIFSKYGSMLESIMFVEEDKELEEMPEQLALVEKLFNFSEAFEELELLDFEIKGVDVFGTEARAKAAVRYQGSPSFGDAPIMFKGYGYFRMKLDHFGCWTIERFKIPGIR